MVKKCFTFRLDPKLVSRIDAAAKRQDPPVNRTQWLRQAVSRYLAKSK
jgi:predicted transcriptional regulator